MIAVVMPTRGLIFTEVENSLEQVRFFCKGDCVFFRSINLPIPDGINELVEQALLLEDLTHILFIEEDTVMPQNGFISLIKENADIAFIDYAVNGWSCSAKSDDDTILWCGLGCTLVKREVFDNLEKPYFRTDKSLRLNDYIWIDVPMKYGGQDIWFFVHAREKGFTIKQVSGECKHLALLLAGTAGMNKGQHVLGEKEKIWRPQIIHLTDDMEVDKVENV